MTLPTLTQQLQRGCLSGRVPTANKRRLVSVYLTRGDSVGIEFCVEQWAAFAPGLEDQAAWRAWACQSSLPLGDSAPALIEMPAMQRRRLERLGRMALQVAWRCQPEDVPAGPMVFGTRHGDLGRTYQMLENLARDEALSPTHFGLSTHNAIAAQYSIARRLTGNYSVVAAGARTAEAVVIEALGLLADGHETVLAVMYDEPLPAAYAEFGDESETAYAWAWRIRRPSPGLSRFTLDSGPPLGDGSDESGLPHGLNVLRFFLRKAPELNVPMGKGSWRWRHHA